MKDLVVFAYDFPHWKSQNVLTRLWLDGHTVSHVLAAPKVQLQPRPANIRKSVRRGPALHPRSVAERMGATYHVVPHQGEAIQALLAKLQPAVGVIAGARILPDYVIHAFSTGIVNLHPGLIPEARGLDALFWSIKKDVPPGVTAHLIDPRVDAGTLLVRRPLEVRADDEIWDINQRISDAELDIMTPALEELAAGRGEAMAAGGPKPETQMTLQQEAETHRAFAAWRHRRATEGATS